MAMELKIMLDHTQNADLVTGRNERIPQENEAPPQHKKDSCPAAPTVSSVLFSRDQVHATVTHPSCEGKRCRS